jgi:DNA-directed RNA polymerase alpha subunit
LSLPEEEEEEEREEKEEKEEKEEVEVLNATIDEPGFSVMLAACAAYRCPHTGASCGVFRV